MGQVVISAHSRTRLSAVPFHVNQYSQNRRSGKKRKKKGQSGCQMAIAEVVKKGFTINATPDAIHEPGSLWAKYICQCTDSFLYSMVTEGIPPDKYREDTSIGADYTYMHVGVNGGKPYPITVHGTNVEQSSFTLTSHCVPVTVTIPAHHRAQSGKSIVRYHAGG